MAKETGARRSKDLVKLSHEHHHALVFCTRLKKVQRVDLKTLQLFVDDFRKNYLLVHFENEEKLFLPLMPDTEIKRQFIAEHKQIKQLVQLLLALKENDNELAIKLSELILSHVRFEEKIMFPYLEKTLQPNELATIGIALSEIEITAHKFTPEFWKNEN
ncbi:MAG: hemerythrin domain-containing protein [Lutibacter sp.]|jgi:hypothetical protein